MVQDAEANAEADKKFEEMITVRNSCDGMIHAARKTLEEAGEHSTVDEREAIEAAIAPAAHQHGDMRFRTHARASPMRLISHCSSTPDVSCTRWRTVSPSVSKSLAVATP